MDSELNINGRTIESISINSRDIEEVQKNGRTLFNISDNIRLGQDLSGKMLLMSFVPTLHLPLPTSDLFTASNNNRCWTFSNSNYLSNYVVINNVEVYKKFRNDSYLSASRPFYIMPENTGAVTQLDKENLAYPYLKVAKHKFRHIQVGDNLSGKTIYITHPDDPEIAEGGGNEEHVTLIDCGGDNYFNHVSGYAEAAHGWYGYVDIFINSEYFDNLVDASTWTWWSASLYLIYTLPQDFGIVTEVASNHTVYKYIWVEENLKTIPELDNSYHIDGEM